MKSLAFNFKWKPTSTFYGTVYFSVEGFLGGESVDEIRSYRVL